MHAGTVRKFKESDRRSARGSKVCRAVFVNFLASSASPSFDSPTSISPLPLPTVRAPGPCSRRAGRSAFRPVGAVYEARLGWPSSLPSEPPNCWGPRAKEGADGERAALALCKPQDLPRSHRQHGVVCFVNSCCILVVVSDRRTGVIFPPLRRIQPGEGLSTSYFPLHVLVAPVSKPQSQAAAAASSSTCSVSDRSIDFSFFLSDRRRVVASPWEPACPTTPPAKPDVPHASSPAWRASSAASESSAVTASSQSARRASRPACRASRTGRGSHEGPRRGAVRPCSKGLVWIKQRNFSIFVCRSAAKCAD